MYKYTSIKLSIIFKSNEINLVSNDFRDTQNSAHYSIVVIIQSRWKSPTVSSIKERLN